MQTIHIIKYHFFAESVPHDSALLFLSATEYRGRDSVEKRNLLSYCHSSKIIFRFFNRRVLRQRLCEEYNIINVLLFMQLFGYSTVQLVNIVRLFLAIFFSRYKRHNKDSKAQPSNNGILLAKTKSLFPHFPTHYKAFSFSRNNQR